MQVAAPTMMAIGIAMAAQKYPTAPLPLVQIANAAGEPLRVSGKSMKRGKKEGDRIKGG
jgi:hypothetical protein